MRWSWKLGTISGIDTRVHATFLLLLAWVGISTWMSGGSGLAVVGGLLFTLAVFGSVLLHEFGHALTARRFGIGTRGITLLPIGGVAELEGSPRSPREELWVALAGPAVNVVLAVVFGAVALSLGALGGGTVLILVAEFTGTLALANVLIGAFNLLPAFPMDGGRVLRALLERRRGRLVATETAAKIGKGFAIAFGTLGLLTNPVLMLVAPFVWFAADRELRAVREHARRQQWLSRLRTVEGAPVMPGFVVRWSTRGS